MSATFDAKFQEEAGRRGLSWVNFKVQAIVESDLNPSAISRAGAMGLAQFMPRTWVWVWRAIAKLPAHVGLPNPFDWRSSIEAQGWYMGWLLDRYRGDWVKSWAAYNAGQGAVDLALLAGGDWLSRMPPDTQEYVERIMRRLGDVHQSV